MPQPGTRSRTTLAVVWLALGVAMVAVPVRLGLTRWSVVLNAHPALPATAVVCALAGLVAVVWAVTTLLLGARYDAESLAGLSRRRSDDQLRRRARWRIGLAVPALVLCVLLASLLAYVHPLAADPVALDAVTSSAEVHVTERLTWYELQGVRRTAAGRQVKPTVGFVFYPGARVDARAYARLLQPLARAGVLVVVLKEPLGIALTDAGQASAPMSVHPEVRSWAVGGHSLDGVAAASYADDHPQVKALVLYAAYPSSALSRRDLAVLSVSGSADGLATPAKVQAAKTDLPRSTRYVVVAGGVHAFFGDYGVQPGDGTPRVERSVAQARIVTATRDFLSLLNPPVKVVARKK